MHKDHNNLTRREMLKLGAMGGVVAGLSSRKAEAWIGSVERPANSPHSKTVHDLGTLSWTLRGYNPFFSNLGQVESLAGLSKSEVGPIKAEVPGSVQLSLLKANIIEDWDVALNARSCEWVENRDWVYQTAIPDQWLHEGDHIRLHFAGLDYCGDILLNNKTIYSFENSFVSHKVDVKEGLNASGNILAVRFTLAPRWMGQIGYTSRFRSWKPRFYYWWDWTSRIVQTAIWDKVTLEVIRGAEIQQLHCTTDVDLSSGKGQLKVWGQVSGGDTVRIKLMDGTREVKKADVAAQTFSASEVEWADLPVALWWPNRMGKQPLYGLEVELLDDSGNLIETQSRRLGFKHVEWRRTQGAPVDADPYLCVLNGKPVFLFGANWTPIRPNFADVVKEDYVKRIAAYAGCGMNLLRVWGGAVLEREDFYDLCDEQGLLVWQEFPLSSSGLDNYPPDGDADILRLEEIAESYIDRRQHHVSLLLWCGGNELQDDKNGVKSSQPTLTIREHPVINRFRKVVATRDPSRRFLATNPVGPVGMFNLQDCGKGKFWDVHGPWTFDGPADGDWKTLWDKDDAMFHSEMGCPSTSPVSIIRRYKGNLPEVPGTEDNPLWNRQMWWIDWPKFVSEKGRQPKDLEEFVAWSQERQTAGLKIALTAAKARFPSCGGLIIWMGHDSFPCTMNTSILDFEGNPKPVVAELTKIASS